MAVACAVLYNMCKLRGEVDLGVSMKNTPAAVVTKGIRHPRYVGPTGNVKCFRDHVVSAYFE